MPGITHWIGQFLLASSTMFAILVGVDMLKGASFSDAWPSALAWALVASAIFIGSRYQRARKGIACATREDPPPKK
jgi:predicted anti-sigma-YlaC factor YlaD